MVPVTPRRHGNPAVCRSALLAALLLAGCAGDRGHVPVVPVEDRTTPMPPQPGDAAVPVPGQSGAQTGDAAGDAAAARAPRAGDPAVLALVSESEQRHRAGQTEAAAAVIERALRIAPRDPVLWHRLARLRLAQGRWQQAAALAQKSTALAGAERGLRAANWRVIARARRGLGDAAGAAEAEAAARDLEEG